MKNETTRERSRKYGPVYSRKLKQNLLEKQAKRDEQADVRGQQDTDRAHNSHTLW